MSPEPVALAVGGSLVAVAAVRGALTRIGVRRQLRVALVAPDSSVLPYVSGFAKVGSTLTATAGAWLGTTPLTYTYSWQRCDANGANCAAITGATSPGHDT